MFWMGFSISHDDLKTQTDNDMEGHLPQLILYNALHLSRAVFMATTQLNGHDLLEVVRQMPPREFDAFLEEAVSVRASSRAATLSRRETVLIKRINAGLPLTLQKRYAQLLGRRRRRDLTPEEQRELLKLTHDAESRDADRAAALVDLAKLRRVPVRVLMKQLGIKARPIHG